MLIVCFQVIQFTFVALQETLTKEALVGTLTTNEDIFKKVLGNTDHLGYVWDVDFGITRKEYFGSHCSKKIVSSAEVQELRQELAEKKQQIQTQS